MDDLLDYVCGQMPLATRVLGRDRVGQIVANTVAEWPAGEMAAVEHDAVARKEVFAALRRRVAARQRYGNPLLLMWAIGMIVSLVWQWWLSRRDNQERMAHWKTAMEAGS